MNISTELIVGTDISTTGKLIIFTDKGKEVWVEAAKAASLGNADTITFEEYSKGDKFIPTKDSKTLNPDGTPKFAAGKEYVHSTSGKRFKCFGKQVVKKVSQTELALAILAANPEARFF